MADIETIEEPESNAQLDFPIVGIGASAGGLEAVTTMFKNIESSTGMAFVLVMHLDPDHESMMAELLSSKTQIPVRQIAENDPLEADCLHVIPPGSSLRIEDGKFKLDKFSEPRGLRRPIDSFFTSLAHVQGEKAACVVLSGTGGDGTAGLRIIKECGGISAVQSPEEARYDGMPFSAIGTKLVDFTLSAGEIISRIKAFFDGADKSPFPENDYTSEQVMREIFTIIKQQLGMDFSGYKRSTLLRRLNRRLQVLEFTDVESYIKQLSNDENEQLALARDFLINVTSFFRDRENFELLRQTVLVPLIENAEASDEVRIWVPGCSSGQEAYSLAMMIDQTCIELKRRPLIQIFATDIDAPMIEQARRGTYPIAAMGEIPAHYQEIYTIGADERFEIISRIREMVRFSVHNAIQDPPFSKIDLISCRNMLIYLGDELQEGILPLMHFSLRPGGHLFLGTSESVTKRIDLFSPLDQRARIFRRNEVPRRSPINLPLSLDGKEARQLRGMKKMSHEDDFPRHTSLNATNVTIYENYAPPFVRVAKDGRIIDSSGDLSLFMMSRPGDERSLDALAREGLHEVVTPMVRDAMESGDRQAMKGVEISSPFGVQKADIIAHPMRDDTVALIFLVKDRLEPIVDQFAVRPVTRDRQIAILQDELQKTRLQLKAKVEEVETANEELKSSNEEMMSMNEELQSANEELTTANEELKNKIDELTVANADLDNFLQSADLGMIVLDRSLKIRHVTDAARRMVPIMRSDEGRSLNEFNVPLGSIDVATETRKVIETGQSFSITTEPNDHNQSFFLRITPYFFNDGAVEGASLTLVNISQEVMLRQDLTLQSEKLHLAMQAAKMGSWDTDLETDEMEVDAIAAEIGGLDGPGTYSRDEFYKYIAPEDRKKMDAARKSAIKAGQSFSHTVRIDLPDGETRWAQVHAQSYITASGKKRKAGLWLDVTETHELQRSIEIESTRRELAMRAGRMGIVELDVEAGEVTADNMLAEHLGLRSEGSVPLKELTANFVPDDAPLFLEHLDRAIETGEEYEFDFRVDIPGQDLRWVRTRGMPYTAIDGRKKVVGPTLDVTAQHKQELLLDEMSHRIKNLFAVISGLIQASPMEHPETKQMASDLIERIISLGKVYDLTRKDLSAQGVNLSELLNSVVHLHKTDQALSIEGPRVFVDTEVVNTLTLIVHELTTNSAKYGALSVPDGDLSISWDRDDDGTVRVTWRELVPNFKMPEPHDGFGSFLIQSGIRQLKGEFDRTFTNDGAEIRFSAEIPI
ncbi:MAG: CheR family methyltransferase [Pseudomonadota bacterium]